MGKDDSNKDDEGKHRREDNTREGRPDPPRPIPPPPDQQARPMTGQRTDPSELRKRMVQRLAANTRDRRAGRPAGRT